MIEKYFSDLKFTLDAIKAEGQSYENLFGSVMTKRCNDFRLIRAYGNIGDRKNDGFIPSTGTYFQVYAPDDINSKRTVVNAVEKLETDFSILLKNWDDTSKVLCFKYVLNDKQKGCPAPVEQKMGELRNLYPDIKFSTFTLDDLKKEFLELNVYDQQSIIGFIPSIENFKTVSVSIIAMTIEHLKANHNVDTLVNEDFNLLTFDQKINFNFLNKQISDLMKKAETQNYILEDYFNRHDDKKLKSLVRDMFVYMYLVEKEIYQTLNYINSPIIFYTILNKCSVDKSEEAINSCLVLMSYFFISCDIFEKPNRV